MFSLPVALPCLLLVAGDLADRVDAYRAAEGVEARVAALEIVAAFTPADSAQEIELTEALVAALDDESYLVQARAVPLVAKAPTSDLVLDGLLGVCRRVADLEKEVERRVREFSPPELPTLGGKSKNAKKAKEDYLRRLEEIRKQTQEMADYFESVKDYSKVREAVVVALPSLNDERSAEGLGLLLASGGFGESNEAVVAGLLGLGGIESVQHLADVFVRFDGVMKERKRRQRELDREKPRKKPNKSYADEFWERKERKRIDGERAAFREGIEAQDRWIERVFDGVHAFAENEGLPAPPRKPLPGREWRAWAKKASKQLAPLGRLSD